MAEDEPKQKRGATNRPTSAPVDAQARIDNATNSLDAFEEEILFDRATMDTEDLLKDYAAYFYKRDFLSNIGDSATMGHDINKDHILLALGDLSDPAFDNKHLTDFLSIAGLLESGHLIFHNNYHNGSLAHALLMSGVSLDKKLNVGNNQSMSVREIVKYPLTQLEKINGKVVASSSHEVQWVASLALELKKRGEPFTLKTKQGEDVTMEELMLCVSEDFFGGKYVTFENTHRAEPLLSNYLDTSDAEGVTNIVDWVFESIKPNDLPRASYEDEIDVTISLPAHFLSVLCLLPRNYPFTNEQRKIMRGCVKDMCEALEEFKYKTDQRIKKFNRSVYAGNSFFSGPICHALDVLKRIPKKWLFD